MGKLTTLLEKIEKLKPEKIITDLTYNTNEEVIEEFVSSKKKDERIAIAANPNLTVEQMTKLSKDKVNGVKEALSYNKNITAEIAKVLLDEEPDRLKFILAYSGDQTDDAIIPFLNTKASDKKYHQQLLVSLSDKPTISPKLYKWILDNITVEAIEFVKEFQRRKDAPKDIIIKIVNQMIKENINTYGGLTRILLNHPAFTNKVLLSLDLSNDAVQEAILYRDSSTKKMVIDVLNNMNENTSGGTLSEGGSKWAKDKDVLNAYLEYVLGTPDLDSYKVNLNTLRNARKIGLNKDLLVQGAKKIASKIRNNNSNGLEAFILNVNYPASELDFIPIHINTIQSIVESPNVSLEKIESIIDMFPADSDEIEKVMWGIVGGDSSKELPDELQLKLKSKLRQKHYFFEYIARGNVADKILKNPEKYMDDLNSEYSSKPSQELDIIVRMGSNKSLNSKQKDKVLKQYDKFKGQSKYTTNPIGNIVAQTTNEPKYLEKLFKQDPNNVWFIWSNQGSTYFQYSLAQQKVIDKYILKTKECEEFAYGVFNSQKKSFKSWIDYAGEKGSQGIDESTALKYLTHFLSIALNSPKLKEYFIADGYLEGYLDNSEIKTAMYALSGKEEYLPDTVKDVFLF